MQSSAQSSRKRLILLGIGAMSGVFLAASGLVEQWTLYPSELPADLVARVRGNSISAERYRQLVRDLATDKRESLTGDDRRFVLNRLIDEELLILRGMELGLAQSSPEVRKALAAAVIAQVVAEAEASPVSEEDLRRLYESDPDFFTSTARYRLWWLRMQGMDETAREIAERAFTRLSNGTNPEDVMASAGLMRSDVLPDTLLPLAKIRDYLGSELIRSVLELQPGQFTAPVAVNGDFHILYLAGYVPGELPGFDEIRPLLDAEHTRRKGNQALRDYLQWLRQRSEIIVQPPESGKL